MTAAAVPAADAQTSPRTYREGEVLVRYKADASTHAAAPRSRVLRIRDGRSVTEALKALRARKDVASAQPNYIARASGFVPNDPGRGAGPFEWQALQWNLLFGSGIDAPGAWDRLIALGKPGGRGVTVAVLDTGVAYTDRGRYQRSPDLAKRTFVRGRDFVDDDDYALDENGHGTHVAGTIAQATNNGIGTVGIAYGVRIMPVRVLDKLGEGDAATIAAGIRFAARKNVPVINLSFEFTRDEFGARITAAQIPDIIEAIRFARRRGSLVVGASGNEAEGVVAYPARASAALAVGAVTEHGCLAEYSNVGAGLDISAPGGGPDAGLVDDPGHCRPADPAVGRDIYQVTFTSYDSETGRPNVRRFGIPGGYTGTSMAAPHVSAVAALVIASGVIGPKPTPAALERRLESTACDLGPPGQDRRYGFGRLDAAAAVGARPPLPTCG